MAHLGFRRLLQHQVARVLLLERTHHVGSRLFGFAFSVYAIDDLRMRHFEVVLVGILERRLFTQLVECIFLAVEVPGAKNIILLLFQ